MRAYSADVLGPVAARKPVAAQDRPRFDGARADAAVAGAVGSFRFVTQRQHNEG
jgi:hypothetical protein